MTTRCAHCQAEIQPGQGISVDIERGSSAAPPFTLHKDPAACLRVAPVRRYSPRWRS